MRCSAWDYFSFVRFRISNLVIRTQYYKIQIDMKVKYTYVLSRLIIKLNFTSPAFLSFWLSLSFYTYFVWRFRLSLRFHFLLRHFYFMLIFSIGTCSNIVMFFYLPMYDMFVPLNQFMLKYSHVFNLPKYMFVPLNHAKQSQMIHCSTVSNAIGFSPDSHCGLAAPQKRFHYALHTFHGRHCLIMTYSWDLIYFMDKNPMR